MSDSSTKTPTAGRRKRAATPRSKTGCVTCKIRRLKCGEERPCCVRCTKSGWQCDGYRHATKPVSRSSTPPELTFAPIRPRRAHFTPSPTPSLHKLIDLDDVERQYFNAFIDDVSVQLPRHDHFFWGGIALQESHSNYAVRHAMVAIGALSKSSQKILSGAYRLGPPHCTHRDFALRQYQKAIHGLRRSIPTLEEEDDVRSTLISCIVLAFFDNFIGNGGFALQHVGYGRDVLCKSMQMLFSKSMSQGQDHKRIAAMFLRLDMESFCAMGTEANRTYATVKPQNPEVNFPTQFVGIEDAILLRNQIIWEGYDLFYRTTSYHCVPLDQIPSSILKERDVFIEQLRHLNSLLDLLAQTTVNDFGCHPLRRAEALKLPSAVLLIRLASGLGPSCSVGDELIPEFAFLLDICQAALEHETMMNSSINEGEVFSFDMRVVAALSLVSTKCRSLSLRRQAINLLLSSHRREWMYDSILAGKVAAWMLNLEEASASRKSSFDSAFGDWYGMAEEDSDDILDGSWVAGEVTNMQLGQREDNSIVEQINYAWGPVVEWDAENGRNAQVRCRQNFTAEDGSTGWSWKETRISW